MPYVKSGLCANCYRVKLLGQQEDSIIDGNGIKNQKKSIFGVMFDKLMFRLIENVDA